MARFDTIFCSRSVGQWVIKSLALPLAATDWAVEAKRCAPLVLEVGVRLRVDVWDRHYVRAKSLK